MFRKKYHVTLSYDEYKLITDCIDDLLLKLLKAKVVQVKIA